MPGTELNLPARLSGTGLDIYQGTAWRGMNIQYLDSSGNALDLDLIAYVMTDDIANNGQMVAQCETPEFADKWRAVYLGPYTTSRLPARQLTVEIKGRLDSDSPYFTIAVLTVRVHAQFTDTTPDLPDEPLVPPPFIP